MPHAARRTRARVLFKENDLLLDGATAPTVLFWPAHAGPAAVGEFLLPYLPLFWVHVLVARTPAVANFLKLARQVLAQPGRDLVAKLLIFSTKTQLHRALPLIE